MNRIEKILDIAKDSKHIRNIAICAHIDHGKTTFADNLLWAGGLLSKTLAGNTRQLDFREDEIERGITIDAISASISSENHIINIIDTPGHVDFGGEVTRAMCAVEGALILCCAVEGIMPQTETVLTQALAQGVKPIVFINKVDRLILETKTSPQKMLERFEEIIHSINAIIEKTHPQWIVSAQSGTVLFGSAIDKWALTLDLAKQTNISLKTIIERYEQNDLTFAQQIPLPSIVIQSLIKHIPNPLDAQNEKYELFWKKNIPSFTSTSICALVTKVEHLKEKSFATIRILNGTLSDMQSDLQNTRTQESIECKTAIRFGPKIESISSLTQGMIGLLLNANVRAGDTLSNEHIIPAQIFSHAYEPIISKSIETVNPNEIEKLPAILKRITNEDPGVIATINTDTGEYLLTGLGELHLDVIEQRINQELKVKTSNPIIVFRETITAKARSQKESVTVTVSPITDTDFTQEETISFGTNILENKTKDIVCVDIWKQQMKSGILCGQSLHKTKTIIEGEGSVAQYIHALQEALFGAKPLILEPVLHFELVIPNEYLGAIGKILKSRTIKIENTQIEQTKTLYFCKSRVTNIFGLAEELKTITKGKSMFVVQKQIFEPVMNQQDAILKIKMRSGFI